MSDIQKKLSEPEFIESEKVASKEIEQLVIELSNASRADARRIKDRL